MSGHLRTTILLLSCLLALALAAPAQAAPSPMEKRLAAKINDARDARGLRQLRLGGQLTDGAHWWARHLIRRDKFHHSNVRPGTGEILAWGTCGWFRPGRAVRLWHRSPDHRAILLRRGFRVVGTGWARGPWRGYDCVEMAVARFR
ncbi:MAG: CAP domain-containing protein [Gaiellaceae bacterium]